MKNSPFRRSVACCVLGGLVSFAADSRAPGQPDQAVIRTGSRLVEIEVVVCDKSGPVVGLKAGDFTVLDEGKRQMIAVFTAPVSAPGAVRRPLSPGTISNRDDHSAAGTTVLLFDQLNTFLENLPYGRDALLKYLAAAPDGERIAIYMLGKDLRVMQDFTQDRAALA